MVKINNVELKIDVMDADFSEKIETELEKVVSKSSSSDDRLKQGKVKRSQYLREQCKIVFDFFDNIWGKGTHEKIFGNRCNLKECLSVFEEFVNAYKEEDKKEAQELTTKYSSNRAQRRNNNRNNKRKR